MKRRVLLLGITAFALSLLAVLPVKWVAHFLPTTVQCANWSGSVWQGRCDGLVLAGAQPINVPSVRWKMHPLSLLRLAVRANFEVGLEGGNATGEVELGRGQRLQLRNVTMNLPFDRHVLPMLPNGWVGQLQGKELQLNLRDRTVLQLSGELQLRSLRDGQGSPLGSYELKFPGAAAAPFQGLLNDAGGPLQMAATVVVGSDRSWKLDGRVAARPEASQALQRMLLRLDALDANGARRIWAEGAFN